MRAGRLGERTLSNRRCPSVQLCCAVCEVERFAADVDRDRLADAVKEAAERLDQRRLLLVTLQGEAAARRPQHNTATPIGELDQPGVVNAADGKVERRRRRPRRLAGKRGGDAFGYE